MASVEIKTLGDELELLGAVLSGNQAAWTLFRQRFDKLIGLCVRKVLRRYHARHTQDDVEDISADIWLLLLADDCRRLRCFDPGRGLRLGTWLGRIASNHAIDQLRRRRNESYLEDLANHDALAVCYTTPYEQLARRQRCALAERAIDGLKEHERLFLLAALRDDRSPADMARELGVSVNTVYSRHFKVRAKLSRLVSRLVVSPATSVPTMAA